ncbi:HD domain-containing protein [Salinispora mooreana]|uniref:HD domain-containing protein n=1 Tax=Salinispora mooreana TaxID=999545 RepID=UPI0009B74B0D|nr:HD domain-containing protein [Salinispora mooreana]
MVEQAASAAQEQLAATLPRRWKHVQAVARKAEKVAPSVASRDRDLLAAAAWLHDVGYAPGVVDTGLHALDGARWLVRQGFDARLAGLVAHHSCACYEAEERGLADLLLGEFEQEHSPVADALWFVDMTTGPDGQDLTAAERLAEIRSRYGPDDVVTRFWCRAESDLLAAVRRAEDRVAVQPM